jgi:hypothetical protein
MPDEITLIERQYNNAIEARDKLNDNYHKWMTYYYVANGAILVAITSLFDKQTTGKGVFILSLLGVFICILWNLSCKGYYYWSNSWINLIIHLEKNVINKDQSKLVYGTFSQEVVDAERFSWRPLSPANISTPKLTLIFSFVSVLGWTTFSICELQIILKSSDLIIRIIISFIICVIILTFYFILPRFVKSRAGNKHVLF